MGGLLTISDKEYEAIQRLVYDKFGIYLSRQKQSLITGRLHKALKNDGFESFQAFYEHVLNDRSGQGLNTLINRISTNHTHFYREPAHFHYYLEHVLPGQLPLLSDKRTSINRIWCAGCASGEEAYTIAMVVAHFESLTKQTLPSRILGTDISDTALQKAKAGIYSAENVQRLPKQWQRRYFEATGANEYIVNSAVRGRVLFRRLNLMRGIYPFKHKFHTIFCRNVMIYFDKATREILAERLAHYLHKGGYLFIGHSESLGRRHRFFEYIKPAIYRKREA